jgi:hypothetical protein
VCDFAHGALTVHRHGALQAWQILDQGGEHGLETGCCGGQRGRAGGPIGIDHQVDGAVLQMQPPAIGQHAGRGAHFGPLAQR